ncbi:unnamed protein product, partial [Ixodes persulcatus]
SSYNPASSRVDCRCGCLVGVVSEVKIRASFSHFICFPSVCAALVMEDHVLAALEDLRYDGPFANEDVFTKEIEDSKSIKFTELVSWLSVELNKLANMEDRVNPITDVEDWNTFLLEMSAFLKETHCPIKALTDGSVNQRLMSKENRLMLLGFLCDELQAARMIKVLKPESNALQVEMQESPTAKAMKGMLMTLGFGKPPPNITPAQLFSKTETKVRELLPKAGLDALGKPLFQGGLTEKQWFALAKLQAQMQEEYCIRRETLIKRLDVTVQSFKWGDRLKAGATCLLRLLLPGKEDKIVQVYQPRRQLMQAEPRVSLGHVLAAREGKCNQSYLLAIEKTSGAGVRQNTKSAVNRVLIGSVPDRGGRPEDQQPPPPEMPSWQKRTEGPPGGESCRGGGTSFSSGRVQGAGWDNNQRGGGYGQRDGRGDGGYGRGDGQRDHQGRGGGRGGYGQRDNYGGQQGGYYGQQEGYGYDRQEGHGGGYGRGGGRGGGYRGKRGGGRQDR